TKEDATTKIAGKPTTISSSAPTAYVIRLVNLDKSAFGHVSTALALSRSYGPREEALEIQISAPEPGATSQLDFVHVETFGGTRFCAVQSTHSTTADLGPGSRSTTIFLHGLLWIIDPDTPVTASWINTDGSTPPTTLFISEGSNWMSMAGSLSVLQAAFPTHPFRRLKLVLEPIS
ncbi:hypothetical protein LB505_003500, partial [Fusarium chuoi]